jgi:hypothetical protein
MPAETLPSIVTVNEIEEKLGLFLSDLDALEGDVSKLDGDPISLEEHVMLDKMGVRWPERELDIRPDVLARLLVFANELEDDVQRITEHGRRLRTSLLSLYRLQVVEKGLADA